MLVLKKISTKKLLIYISIIVFMASGTAFMLYENKKLTTYKIVNVNIPIVNDNSMPAIEVTDTKNNALETGEVDNQTTIEPSQILDKNKINQNSGFNLNIFSSDKFKNLRENVFTSKEQLEVGKRNPFKLD